MTQRWMVSVRVCEDIEVVAGSQEEAEERALEMFDPTALDYEVFESYEIEGETK